MNRTKQKSIFCTLGLAKSGNERGQSLVEMAIIAPLLIFLLIGVFEVGAALRSYVVLVNVNREITRFAVRPGYVDFSEVDLTLPEPIVPGYDRVFDWIGTSLAGQLALDFNPNDDNGDGFPDGNATMIISHIVVDTELPCEDIHSNPDDCDCDEFINNLNYTKAFTFDDEIIHPGKPGKAYHARIFGPEETVTGNRSTKINYDELVYQELVPQNNQFNCEIIKKGGLFSANNLIITEVFVDQPQLFGFPFISNPFTDPVPLYTHTSMRLNNGSRDIDVDTTGPVCDASPLTVAKTDVDTWSVGDTVDILGGPNSSDFGWLAWNPQETNVAYLRKELQFSKGSLNDFTNVADKDDHTLSVGDWVRSMQGTKPVHDAVEDYLVDQVVLIPVYDNLDKIDNDNPPPAKVDAYRIVAFVRARVTGVFDVSGPNKYVEATYLGDATAECMVP